MATTILKPGDLAPEFIGKDQDGKTIKLSDFKGKKLILYFYPRTTPAVVPLKLAVYAMVMMIYRA